MKKSNGFYGPLISTLKKGQSLSFGLYVKNMGATKDEKDKKDESKYYQNLYVDRYVLTKTGLALLLSISIGYYDWTKVFVVWVVYTIIESFLDVALKVSENQLNNSMSYLRATINGFLNYFEFVFSFSYLYMYFDALKFTQSEFQERVPNALEYIYFSFVTVSTIGYGDLAVSNDIGRILVMIQATIFLVFVLVFLNHNIARI
ncbi:potassium channel family protein [Flagellimonas sp.]|uniref:potassium channel family protein n=1 Tax=Flagellimonas sp. TaxID=2058762 RepID=UPI003B59FA43